MKPLPLVKALARMSGAFVLLSSLSLRAQFSEAKLQATGLTCALCSKAIHQSLTQLPFVGSVEPELKTSTFDIRFKPGFDVSTGGLRAAVEEAGFFIGSLVLTPFPSVLDSLQASRSLVRSGRTFELVEVLVERSRLKVLDKNFLVDKEYRRLSARYPFIKTVSDSVLYLLPVNK